MSEEIKVGDYVTPKDPDLKAVFTGRVKWVEGSGYRRVIIERPDGSRSVLAPDKLRKVTILDVLVDH